MGVGASHNVTMSTMCIIKNHIIKAGINHLKLTAQMLCTKKTYSTYSPISVFAFLVFAYSVSAYSVLAYSVFAYSVFAYSLTFQCSPNPCSPILYSPIPCSPIPYLSIYRGRLLRICLSIE